MKRFSHLLIYFLVLFLIVGIPGSASSTTDPVVRIKPVDVMLPPGGTATVEVYVDNVVDLRAFDVEVLFDAGLLSASNLVLGDILASGIPAPSGVDNDLGIINFGNAIIGDDVQSGSGVLFSFDVTSKGQPGEVELAINLAELVDADINLIPCSVQHGQVWIFGAMADVYQTSVDEILMIAAPGVFMNDILPDGYTVTADLEDPIPPGTGTLASFDGHEGGFSYSPPVGWEGTTGFTYRACVGDVCSDPAVVTIIVGDDHGYGDHFIFLPLIYQ